MLIKLRLLAEPTSSRSRQGSSMHRQRSGRHGRVSSSRGNSSLSGLRIVSYFTSIGDANTRLENEHRLGGNYSLYYVQNLLISRWSLQSRGFHRNAPRLIYKHIYNTNVWILAAGVPVMVPLVLQLFVQFPFSESVLLLSRDSPFWIRVFLQWWL